MNKSDKKLIIIVSFLCLLAILSSFLFQESHNKVALVYYKNELIKTIPLLEETKEYQVIGEKGILVLETKNGKIRVKQENSPLHICSKQGYIQKSTETIVCLPNQIVIKIKENDNLDTVVR